MCLRWIAHHQDLAPSWQRVLDYGCGSGILAIGAALHGARAIDAVDIDPAAVTGNPGQCRDQPGRAEGRPARWGGRVFIRW